MPALRERFARPALALIALAVLACGVAACGDSDDGGSGAGPSADERQIRSLVPKLEKAFKTRDVKTLCAAATAAQIKQIKSMEDYPTCEKGLYDAMTNDHTGEARVRADAGTPHVQKVVVRGGKAMVTARAAGKRLQATFQKEGGDWKLAAWFH